MRSVLLENFYNSAEYNNRLDQRLEILKACADNPLNIANYATEVWSIDPIAFIETFGFVIIPEFNNSVKPFFLFPYQKKIIQKIWDAELSGMDHEILIDKPRGMGLTWTLVWYQIWRWLFSPNWGGFNLSRSESEVDDGTNDPGCHDEDTEVFTDSGWKFFKDLDKTEKVLTKNLYDNHFEWQLPFRYINQKYSGDMYAYKARHTDFIVTPDHKFFVTSRKDKNVRFKKVEEIYKSFHGTYTIPVTGEWCGVDNASICENDCAIMGFYLSEGWVGNKSNIYFAKTNGIKGGKSGWKGNVRKDFEKVLSNSKLEWYDYTDSVNGDRGVYFLDTKRKEYFEKLGKHDTKYIPKEYKELPSRKLRVLMEWMLKGDGYINDGLYYYGTTSKKLAEDFQEIAIKLGYYPSLRVRDRIGHISVMKDGRKVCSKKLYFEVCLLHKDTQSFYPSHNEGKMTKTKYNGNIYCVEVKNHTLLTRRGLKICWSGNSSIFGKYRWAIQHLPAFLKPTGFVPKGKKGTPTDMMLRISNPQIGSSLIGSSTNQSAGRSRRYALTFVDECFSIEHFQSVYRSLQSVSRVKVFVSTVKSGRIYQDFKTMCETAGNYITLSWKDHPFKDQEWYDEQIKKAEFDPDVMKEIEVDYSVNIKSQYYPEIRQAKVSQDIPYIRGKPLYVFMDWGSQDFTCIGWAQFDGQYLSILECITSSRKNLDWYVPFLNPMVVENPSHYTPYYQGVLKKVQAWSKPTAYFGEAAHFQKQMPTNRSIADELNKNGIRLMFNNYAVRHEPRRHAVSMMLPKTVFNMGSDGVMELYDAIANSRYAESNRGTSKESHMKPVHDTEISDMRSAFENLCSNIPRMFRNQREDMSKNNDNKFANSLIRYLKI